jgi:hypothetical protein
MSDFFDTYRQQGQRQNVFARFDDSLSHEEVTSLAEVFDEWETEVLVLRLCHPAAFAALQRLIRRN